jgi:hypothetical protein
MRATFADPDPNCHPLIRAAQLSETQIRAAAQVGIDTADLEADLSDLAARENPLVAAARQQAIRDGSRPSAGKS